jgi:hypothetical protein
MQTQSIGDKSAQVSQILAGLIDDLVATVVDSSQGYVPAGHMYAALMGTINLDTFNVLMAKACATGKIERRGDCYHAINAGAE